MLISDCLESAKIRFYLRLEAVLKNFICDFLQILYKKSTMMFLRTQGSLGGQWHSVGVVYC